MNKPSFLSRSFPFFLYLLPVFFCFHVYVENYAAKLGSEAMLLTGIYWLAGFILSGLTWLIYKNIRKASLLVMLLLAFNIFFGSFHDFLREVAGQSFITKFSFLIIVFVLIWMVTGVYLQRTRNTLHRLSYFLNILFLVLILIDLITVIPKIGSRKVFPQLAIKEPCNTCAKPDIYFILADEYAGKTSLQEKFGFDNTPFENKLRERGFHIVANTRSNYNATAYSMASMLNMQYLDDIPDTLVNHPDMFVCRDRVADNEVTRVLKAQGYEIKNYSFFDFAGKTKAVTNPFFVTRMDMFTSQSFIRRFVRNLGFHFASQRQSDAVIKAHLYNNRAIDSMSRVEATTRNSAPRFVYTHLAIPHHPYYYDSAGKEIRLVDKIDRKGYIQYLLYSNDRLLSLVDHIMASSVQPPVIILMSDHGFRQYNDDTPHAYYFMNLNAILLPQGNYEGFYDGMSNVNEFRVFLNKQFAQQLPLLKDSTIFLTEPDLLFR